ncbi:hypothetical protein BpHYR1_046156 [Brachionus plicatilis]|uniref:Uncharacterized protein n=1 Tax=Brachionus plicatilis TaxID=10195 RepID=A0A3M7QHL8_BRAPC|nr:hypothetical protein BpHYR1_046156 [Brachionus plicatilis]
MLQKERESNKSNCLKTMNYILLFNIPLRYLEFAIFYKSKKKLSSLSPGKVIKTHGSSVYLLNYNKYWKYTIIIQFDRKKRHLLIRPLRKSMLNFSEIRRLKFPVCRKLWENCLDESERKKTCSSQNLL